MGNENRSSQRKLVAVTGFVAREDTSWSSSEVAVQTLNLSRTGALLQVQERLLPGEVCALTLVKPNGGYGDIPARVVWVARGDKGYRAGVAFRNLNADQEYLVDLHLVRSEKH